MMREGRESEHKHAAVGPRERQDTHRQRRIRGAAAAIRAEKRLRCVVGLVVASRGGLYESGVDKADRLRAWIVAFPRPLTEGCEHRTPQNSPGAWDLAHQTFDTPAAPRMLGVLGLLGFPWAPPVSIQPGGQLDSTGAGHWNLVSGDQASARDGLGKTRSTNPTRSTAFSRYLSPYVNTSSRICACATPMPLIISLPGNMFMSLRNPLTGRLHRAQSFKNKDKCFVWICHPIVLVRHFFALLQT
ncbi:hypothetical protein PCL_09240 [Purpureocillium lilacinum]|uniref:Uncharacterized protein n=1 Tax=Purpureocillium lilacinum TaxID=33203 RepID=A0A2U3EHH4_PURLI|nr:hypothetical protein PCL_09240 [Purpureocillium lilacinum]